MVTSVETARQTPRGLFSWFGNLSPVIGEALGPHGIISWALVYFVLAEGAERLALGPNAVVLVWPAGGVALFLALRHGVRGLLPVFIGGLLTTYETWTTPVRFLVDLCLVSASVAGAYGGAFLYRNLATSLDVFRKTREMLILIVAGCLGFSVIAAFLGSVVLSLSDYTTGPWSLATLIAPFSPWLISDLTGAVIVTPLLLAWSNLGEKMHSPFIVLALWALLATFAMFAFSLDLPPNFETAAMLLLLGPTLVAAALTMSPRGFTLVMITSSLLVIGVVAQNVVALPDANRSIVSLLMAQLYIVTVIFTHLALYAANTENRISIAERTNLSKHFSPNMVDLIAKSGRPFREPQLQQATVLFCDLRNFTTLSEEVGPAQTMALLRDFHAAMSDRVFKHGGTIDRFIGDGMMAVFGIPTPKSDDADRAVKCALSMIDALKDINARRQSEGLNPLRMGIGIHTGELVLGDIGSETTMSVTVVGDTVNAASRIQTLCREYEAALVVSDATLSALAEPDTDIRGRLRHVGKVPLRGKRSETDIWALPLKS